MVTVFTFALVGCASAAAREHLATSTPLTVTARVVPLQQIVLPSVATLLLPPSR
ncbi:hypothetical protein [Antrihabitans stalactiti]|uniref:hypothetical protein n=1 Tax=Antrihabitans stalactiti TaxID=2584121 RepID=UPI00146C1DFD|nr:hypothetical protein [Antrihabitans stalactiti]